MSATEVLNDPPLPGPVIAAAHRLRDVEAAVAALARLGSVARLMSATPRAACRATGLQRAMVSHLRGDRIGFASVSFDGDPLLAADFARVARAVRPRLDRCAPEHEAVVRRRPVLVSGARNAFDRFDPLVRAAQTEAYVVAPIVCERRVVGLLHADAVGRVVDEVDRELLWTFAVGLGWAMEEITARAGVAGAGVGVAAPPPPSDLGLGGAELAAELEGMCAVVAPRPGGRALAGAVAPDRTAALSLRLAAERAIT